jgi:hypothetical protein
LQTGSEITASIEVESREYNGRWYTDIRAWKVAAAGVGGPGMPPPQSSPMSMGGGAPVRSLPSEPDYSVQGGDDMPF